MKAKYVLCAMIVAIACSAQQPSGSTATTPTPVRISPEEASALLVEKVVPAYPEAGIANRIQNNEILTIQIDEQGNVAGAKVRSGHPAFAATSLDAVKQWKFRPYLLNGAPVRVETTVLIAFRFPNAEIAFKIPEGATARANAMAPPPEDRNEFGKLLVDAKLLDSRLMNRVEPRYPEMARIAHIQGNVLIHVLIDKDGHVAKLRPVSGHPILIQAALDAVKQWTYKPYEVGGEVIEIESTVKLEFPGDGDTKKQ